MYSLPQEIEVWYIIPAIRREFAFLLSKKHKLTLEKTGNILGISKSAVSQYLSKKRGKKAKFPEKIKKEIEKSVEVIIKDNDLALCEIIRILKLIRKEKCCCSVCRKYNKGIIKLCKMNLEGE